jgi:hypothetical protein
MTTDWAVNYPVIRRLVETGRIQVPEVYVSQTIDCGIFQVGFAGSDFITFLQAHLAPRPSCALEYWELVNPMRMVVVPDQNNPHEPQIGMSDLVFGNTKPGVAKTREIVIPCVPGALSYVTEGPDKVVQIYAQATSRLVLTGGPAAFTLPPKR